MTDQTHALRDDVAYMRAMTEEGRRTPLVGGVIPIAAGLIYAAASLTHWAILTGRFGDVPGWSFLANWLGAGVVFGVTLAVVDPAIRRRPGALSTANRASSIAWINVGWATGVIFLGFANAARQTGEWVIMDLLLLVVFALYGAAWGVSAGMSGRRWLWLVSIGSFVSVVGISFLVGRPQIYLSFAAGLVCWVVLPGVAMMLQARSAD